MNNKVSKKFGNRSKLNRFIRELLNKRQTPSKNLGPNNNFQMACWIITKVAQFQGKRYTHSLLQMQGTLIFRYKNPGIFSPDCPEWSVLSSSTSSLLQLFLILSFRLMLQQLPIHSYQLLWLMFGFYLSLAIKNNKKQCMSANLNQIIHPRPKKCQCHLVKTQQIQKGQSC